MLTLLNIKTNNVTNNGNNYFWISVFISIQEECKYKNNFNTNLRAGGGGH